MRNILSPLLAVVVILSLTTGSCTIQKRLYRRGYTVTWHHRYKADNEPSTVVVVDQSESASDSIVPIHSESAKQAEHESLPEESVELAVESNKQNATEASKRKDDPQTEETKQVVTNDQVPRQQKPADPVERHLDEYAAEMWLCNLVLVIVIIAFLGMGSVETLGAGILAVILGVLLVIAMAIILINNIILGIYSLREIKQAPEYYRSPALTWFGMFFPITVAPLLFLIVLMILGLVY